LTLKKGVVPLLPEFTETEFQFDEGYEGDPRAVISGYGNEKIIGNY